MYYLCVLENCRICIVNGQLHNVKQLCKHFLILENRLFYPCHFSLHNYSVVDYGLLGKCTSVFDCSIPR